MAVTASEVIPNEIAAKILGMKKQYMFDLMRDKRIDIGTVIPGKDRHSRSVIYVYRAKLARHLGREPDHVWDEERA